MQIEQIKHIKDTAEVSFDKTKPSQQPKKTVSGKKCLYYSDELCSVHTKKFKVCEKCPYGYSFCFPEIIGSIYEKAVGLAICIFSRDMTSLKSIEKKDKLL